MEFLGNKWGREGGREGGRDGGGGREKRGGKGEMRTGEGEGEGEGEGDLGSPVLFIDVGFEMVMPALAALLAISPR
jgi:hypothetical protein